MTGVELDTLITSVNGGAAIDATLKTSLIKIGKSILEGERDWLPLRKTNSSISFSQGSTWQTAYSLATITDFLRFYGDFPIRVFDGNNRVEYYRQVPYNERLQYKDINNTFVYEESTNSVYFNGVHSLGGTLYINYIKDTPAIDLTVTTDLKTNGSFPFPSRYHDVLAFYAVGVNKGAIDYDEINRAMLPANQAVLVSLKNALEKWDTQKQLTEVEQTDPYSKPDLGGTGFRSNAINIQ